MPAQYWTALLNAPGPTASGTAYSTSTTITDVSPTPQFVLPANFLQPGSKIRLRASGVFSNTSTPTLILGVYYGAVAGTALAATGAITTITAATAWSWELEYEFTCRTIGSSGTVFGQGKVRMPASLTQFQAEYALPATAPAAVTVDTTAAKALTIGATWGTNSASNTLQCHNFSVESLA